MATRLRKLFTSGTNAKPTVEERIHYKIRAFNSIISILTQLQRDPPFQDNEMPPKTPPSSSERRQLKLSNALAHLAVIDTDVVATTLYTPEMLSVMTWNQEQSPDDKDEPAQDTKKPKSIWDRFLPADDAEAAQDTENPKSLWDRFFWMFSANTRIADMRPGIPYPGPCIVDATPPEGYPKGSNPRTCLLQYLDEFPKKKWTVPNKSSHLWILINILVTFKEDPTHELLLRFLKYTIPASHLKIQRRFEYLRSKQYLDCFKGVETKDIHVPAFFERPRLELEVKNDRNFLHILEERYVIPDYQNSYPNIAASILLKEHPDFELFGDTTCKEYHDLFIDLVSRYQQLVDQIAALAQQKKSFECILDLTVKTGHALLKLVKSRSFYLYLSTIAPELLRLLSKDSHIEPDRRNAQEHNNKGHDNEECDNFEEHDVNAGVELWEPVKADTTTASWKPFKSWIMLILAQFQAANDLCNFISQTDLSRARIDVKVVYAPLVSDQQIPLEQLFTQFIPQGPVLGPDNTKLLDFIKTANTLTNQIERLNTLQGNWDPIHGAALLGEVFNEASKQYQEDDTRYQEDSNQRFDPTNVVISMLSAEIIRELPLPAQETTILAKITSLKGLLTKRRDERYKLGFSETATFNGTIHCEAALASILDKTTREAIQTRIEKHNKAHKKSDVDEIYYKKLSTLLEDTKGFTRVIGISKRCCPVCHHFLAHLSKEGPNKDKGFVTSGYHNIISNCTLPEWTPERLVDGMIETFAQLLRMALVQRFYQADLPSYRDRRQSSGSGFSVGSDAMHLDLS